MKKETSFTYCRRLFQQLMECPLSRLFTQHQIQLTLRSPRYKQKKKNVHLYHTAFSSTVST